MLVLSHVDGVVVNGRVDHWPGYVDAPSVIVLTDVVAHYSTDIANVFAGIVPTFVADQHEAAVIFVAVVILNDSIAAVPIGIEALTVALPMGQIDFLKLDCRIVRAPRPDTHIKTLGSLVRLTNNVVFHQGAISRHRHDTVAANIVEGVVPYHHAQAGIPLRAHPMRRPSENAAAVDVMNLIVLDPKIDETARLGFARTVEMG